ncbi:MAG: hypothetical protein K8R90_01620 [Candidatus Cloacimonetes bacterium]|nr:hypothetical protein [Candidatus Cloacimonadota bacterium]
MRYGVCGVACEACPRRRNGNCPNGDDGCVPRKNNFCKICSCGFSKGVRSCFECAEFPCELTREGPISFGFCQYIAGTEHPG